MTHPADTYELLRTKLVAPQLQASLVPRKRLLDQLEHGLNYKVTLISAPAGFGKTTLVSEWMAERRRQHRLPPVGWVALDDGDNDPVRFWRYVLTACQAFAAGLGESALKLLKSSLQPPFEALLTQFINDVAQLSGHVVLVLEDFHVIVNPQVQEAMAFLLDHLPPALHLVLITRSDPALPLARLRARNELHELRAADLRFTLEETHVFLQQTVPFPLPADVIAQLSERTEGWAAGLRLVALALQKMQAPSDIERYLTGFTGSHRPILDYLVADVFAAQPEAIQTFLLQTSFLSRLTAPLCDAVTRRDDSTFILEQLERDNLFLVALDDAGHWYRYHALFAEAMQHYARQRLGAATLHGLAQQASRWYEAREMLAEAIEASLHAQDYERAIVLLKRIIAPQLVQNEFHTLRRWLEQFPEAALRPHPNLCLTYAIAILFTSDRYAPATLARLQPPLQMAEQQWQAEGNRAKLGEVLSFRSLVAFYQWDLRRAFADARQALELLPEDNGQWRGISLIFVGLDELLDGRLTAARLTLRQALELCQRSGNMYGTLDTLLLLGRVYTMQGKLHQAEQVYRRVLDEIERTPLDRDLEQIRRARALIGLSTLDLEWNALESAQAYAAQAVTIEQYFADEELKIQSALALARALFARGERVQAQEQLYTLLARTKSTFLRGEVETCQARFALNMGDLAAVQNWQMTHPPSADLPHLDLERRALVIARLQIRQGEAEAALPELERWLVEAQQEGRTRSELEIKLLLALAYAAAGESNRAREALIQALALGQPEGYRRVFLDEGDELAALLRDTLPDIQDESLAAYTRALLYSMAQEHTRYATDGHDSDFLIEPLSEQEQRVLRLIAAGLSNPEIAAELVISINTVKTHVKNIYAKLNVSSREDARLAARHLNLL
ncbi:MAG: tetratricopeptide repeat protein [Chloroflexi bacterium]|nr:tetratricopeptide repeat protein [Chloroflexota bacterium]